MLGSDEVGRRVDILSVGALRRSLRDRQSFPSTSSSEFYGVEMLRPPPLNRAAFRDTAVSSRLQVVVAVLSFIIYASAVVVLQRHRDNSFFCERIGLATAVSHVVYGAPFGKVYPAIQIRLLDMQAPVETVFDRVIHLGSPPENPMTPINDGIGIGFIVVASWAMLLFGPHLVSLPFFMLGLMAISAGMFLWRFGDNRSAVVTVTFFSLTLMLCTPLVWDLDIASQIPIGGMRYFSLLAILPAFHLGLELTDGQGPARGARRLHASLLAGQVVLLVLAIFVRGSAVFLVGPILLVALAKVWRSHGTALRSLRRKATVIAVVGAVFLGSLLVALPSQYVRDGRVTTLFWHRAVISLGVNPAWPFGNLREIYDCKGDIPEGLLAGAVDRNGHCIWWHWIRAHNISTDVAILELYGRRYEAVMRATLFDIARAYPYEVLATFYYYKPKWIVQSMEYLALNSAVPSPILKVLVIAGFVNFLGLLVITASFSTGSTMARLTGLSALFGISSIPTYLVAWANPHTTADLLFYCLSCIGLALGAAVQPMRAAVGRMFAARARA